MAGSLVAAGWAHGDRNAGDLNADRIRHSIGSGASRAVAALQVSVPETAFLAEAECIKCLPSGGS